MQLTSPPLLEGKGIGNAAHCFSTACGEKNIGNAAHFSSTTYNIKMSIMQHTDLPQLAL